MSYISHYYHIVFRTYLSQPTLPEESKRIMFTYIYKLISDKGWKMIRINGYLNHIHILLALPANVKVCDVVALLKSQTTKVFRRHSEFPKFWGWGGKYASFTVSYYEVETIRNYIVNQESHHSVRSFRDEILELFRRHGLSMDDFFEENPKT